MKNTCFDDENDFESEAQKSIENREVSYFQCACGIHVAFNLANGPMRVALECPDLECRRVYEFQYTGRKRGEIALARPPDLRLVHDA